MINKDVYLLGHCLILHNLLIRETQSLLKGLGNNSKTYFLTVYVKYITVKASAFFLSSINLYYARRKLIVFNIWFFCLGPGLSLELMLQVTVSLIHNDELDVFYLFPCLEIKKKKLMLMIFIFALLFIYWEINFRKGRGTNRENERKANRGTNKLHTRTSIVQVVVGLQWLTLWHPS